MYPEPRTTHTNTSNYIPHRSLESHVLFHPYLLVGDLSNTVNTVLDERGIQGQVEKLGGDLPQDI